MYAFNETVDDDFDLTSLPMHEQMVSNVTTDMADDQISQNASTAYMETTLGYMDAQSNYNVASRSESSVQQTVTYNLNAPPFDIEDFIMRRQFFRKVFIILLLQHILALPVIGIFKLCLVEPIPIEICGYYWTFGIFMFFIVMYSFSNYRRHMPMNVIALVITTLFVTILVGIHATYFDTAVAFIAQTVVIAQLFIMIIYSHQTRFKFKNLNAILVTIFISIITFLVVCVIEPRFSYALILPSALYVIYCVYDTQLMLSGHHDYNLKAEEHLFAAVNIYADLSNLIWRFLRYTFLDPLIKQYEFLKKCCFAEVC